MRVLGIDPGLRTTGFGVVERERRAPALRRQRHDPHRRGRARRPARPAEDHLRRRARGDRALCADLRLDRDRLRQRQSAVDAAARPGARRRPDGARRRRPRGRRVHRAADEEGDRRPRPGEEGTGPGRWSMRLLGLPGLPGKDAADALGLAICHAHAGASFAALGRATSLARRTPRPLSQGSDLLSARFSRPDVTASHERTGQAPRRQSAPHVCPLSKTPASSTPAG